VIAEVIQNSDVYKAMREDEQKKLIWMIGCKLDKM
jgi:hypothetical protein